MISLTEHPDGLVLRGLDGSNPLGFLAALGALRALTLAWPDRPVRMAWTQCEAAWRPLLCLDRALDGKDVVKSLHERLQTMVGHLALRFSDDLSMSPSEFRDHAQTCVTEASLDDSIAADFAAAFACDALRDLRDKGKDRVQDTALRTMSGAGNQHFLESMRRIIKATTPDHLRKSLFAEWAYDDPLKNLTLRWDPADDRRYARQWRNPSGDPTREKSGGMLGANCLAIEGLPLIVCAPVGARLHTTGFVGRGSRDTYLTWPIWACPVSLDVCRSLLALPALQDNELKSIAGLRDMGIAAAFRSQRITVDKFRNFTPATAMF